MRSLRFVLSLIVILGSASPIARAQSDAREERVAKWEGYSLAPGDFVRYEDHQKGYSFWLPSGWQEARDSNGFVSFAGQTPAPRVLVVTEDIPEGLGIGAYTSAFLQQLRSVSIVEDSVLVRSVLVGGTAGKEITLDIHAPNGTPNGGIASETIWLAAVGARAYVFLLVTAADTRDRDEQVFKRMMLSARIGAAGHWEVSYATVRSQFLGTPQPAIEREVEANVLADQIRGARMTAEDGGAKLAALFATTPGAALDLLTDSDPQVRTAAVLALDQTQSPRATGPLVWALEDPDAHCSSAAALALAKRGPEATDAVRQKLASLTQHPESLIRFAAAMKDSDARLFAEQLIASESAPSRIAGLKLAVALRLPELKLPYLELLQGSDPRVMSSTVEAIGVRQPAEVIPELLKLVGTNYELRAVRALGEIAPAEITEQFSTRIAEIDKRMKALFPAPKSGAENSVGSKRPSQTRHARNPRTPPPPNEPPREKGPSDKPPGEPSGLSGVLMLEAGFWAMAPEDYGKRVDAERLAYLRGELVLAEEKIRIRGRWEAAKDAAARRAVREDAKKNTSMAEWVESRLQEPEEYAGAVALDTAKLADAPTTGETLFPANTSLYLMAPNFEETIAKINSALAGIQMESVRDQSLFVVVLKSLKAKLAEKLSAEAESDASAVLGLDLRKPVAVASWPGKRDDSPPHSALVARVLDPDRFERAVAVYLKEAGNFDSFATTASAAVRIAGVIPATIPASVALVANPDLAKTSVAKAPLVNAHIFVHGATEGQQRIVEIEKIENYASGVTRKEAVFLTYLGSTAVLAPTRAALIDVLAASTGRAAFAQSRDYAAIGSEHGEVIFFSRAGELFKDFLKDSNEEMFVALAAKLGVETGSLQITPSAWQTAFHLRVDDDSITKSIREVAPPELSAPRELLPASTVVYAGGVVDPAGAWQALKGAVAESKQNAGSPAKATVTDEEIEKSIIPHLQGEMGFALLSMLAAVQGDTTNIPAVFFFKLKDGDLARLLREQKVFSAGERVPIFKFFGEPITRVGRPGDSGEFYMAATDQWLVLAENELALASLDSPDKLGGTRDYMRTVAAAPSKHLLFLTYSLEAALAEAQEKFSGDETAQGFRAVMNAVTHAFHSQRAFVSIGKGQWDGELTVAFDRAGRYSVGELERKSRELDVANANIAPSGVRILQPTKLEQLRLRLRVAQPGIVSRLREDFREIAGQRIESATETELVFSTRARRIDNGQTIALPVQSAELEPYLRADRRIRSAAPEIVSLAKKIAGDDHDGRSVARKLGEWTFKNLKWKRVESDAVETLAKREADCLEHSELYVSLARALGLPARVVFGLAYGSGSFGGHAWVEIYLGDWVEIDPSWGSMDSVDASHLRFKLDSVTSLMLSGQIEMEVLDARGLIVDDQRDPIRLIHAIAKTNEQAPAAFAYDVQLAADASLGDGALGTLDDKQRAAVVRAFDRAVVKDLSNWQTHWGGSPRVLTKTVEGDHARLVVLRSHSLVRIALAKRDDGWFVTEVEDMDSGIPLFGGAFNNALHRGIPLERLASANPIESLKEIDQVIAAHGESPELLLLQSQQAAQADLSAGGKEEKPASAPALPNSDDILRKIVAKWPGFAPAYRELARALASDESSADEAIALFEKYTTLVPFDPRPWEELGAAYEEKKRLDDAEKALRQFVQLDPENPASSIKLASFLAARGKDQDASKSVAAAFERGGHVNEALDSLEEEV